VAGKMFVIEHKFGDHSRSRRLRAQKDEQITNIYLLQVVTLRFTRETIAGFTREITIYPF